MQLGILCYDKEILKLIEVYLNFQIVKLSASKLLSVIFIWVTFKYFQALLIYDYDSIF